jgi:hypothetical protein
MKRPSKLATLEIDSYSILRGRRPGAPNLHDLSLWKFESTKIFGLWLVSVKDVRAISDGSWWVAFRPISRES